MQDNMTNPICDIYSYSPTDTTADGEWMWEELIGLLNDECLRVCNSARAEQGRAWRNPELLRPNNLRDAVLADNNIMDMYNSTGEQGFFDWLEEVVDSMMDNNRPNYK